MDQSLLPNIYDFISKTYPFSQLSQLEMDAVATAVKISYHAPGDILDNEDLAGAGLYMVRTGACEEINKRDGKLRARMGVGDTFGYTQIDKQGESDYKVRFLENTLLYFINSKVLKLIFEKNKAVGSYFSSNDRVRLHSSQAAAAARREASGAGRTVFEAATRHIPVMQETSTIQDVAVALRDTHSEMAVIASGDAPVGVITKTDISNRAMASGLPATSRASEIMSRGIISIEGSEPVEHALELMVMNNIKCLPVTDNGRFTGIITPTRMLRDSRLESVYLLRDVSNAEDFSVLPQLSHRVKGIFTGMLAAGMAPHDVQRMMSRIADVFYQKIISLNIKKAGTPPCPFAWFAAGSLARCEVQFLSDQDNGIILEKDPGEEGAEYFRKLSEAVCHDLDSCGYPLCEGNYMASNPKWRVTLEKWEENYSSWIADNTQTAILNSMVFLDIRHLYGNEKLTASLKRHLMDEVNANSRFLATLCTISTNVAPPLGTFRQFVLTKDGENEPYFNIKKQAVNLIVEMARLYALAARSGETDTYARLDAAREAGVLRDDDCRDLEEAYTFINSVRFSHQLNSMKSGAKLTNNLPPSELSQFERNHLRDAFRIIARQQQAAKVRFAGGKGIL
jgi:CBS domain-containing protein